MSLAAIAKANQAHVTASPRQCPPPHSRHTPSITYRVELPQVLEERPSPLVELRFVAHHMTSEYEHLATNSARAMERALARTLVTHLWGHPAVRIDLQHENIA
jgi:hypothetical protein